MYKTCISTTEMDESSRKESKAKRRLVNPEECSSSEDEETVADKIGGMKMKTNPTKPNARN